MNSDQLSKQQLQLLTEQTGRRLRWVSRVVARMDQLRFPLDDQLRAATEGYQDKLGRLYRELFERRNGSRRG